MGVNVDIDNVLKIDVDDGDILLVTIPDNLSRKEFDEFSKYVRNGFNDALKDKKVKIVIVPSNIKVELIKSSMLEDKE